MFITTHISTILIVTGAITALPILQFFFPVQVLKLLNKFDIKDDAGLFFARHWGLLAFCIGVLLMYAAWHPELRTPIMLLAALEKAGIVGLVALHWQRPYAKGLIGAAVFDSICVVLYGAYLLRVA